MPHPSFAGFGTPLREGLDWEGLVSEYKADVLVIGAGGAGLRAAIAAREKNADVLVVEKGVPGEAGCTQNSASDWMAYGAAFGHADPKDSPHEHWLDIMIKGALVAQPELARRIAFDAPDRLLDLERYGACFDKKDGKYVQILSDGARFPRACGKGTDTGPEIVRVLLAKAREMGVGFADNVMIADLLTTDSPQKRVIGCWGLDLASGEAAVFEASSVIVATGGAGDLYSFNVFPGGMTGDGTAMAYRAGARLANMEFIQIGPCIIHPVKFALSGVFWRMNPRLLNGKGEEFLARRVPPDVDLANALHLKGVSFPFSIRNSSMYIDIAIYEEITSGEPGPHGGVFLDISHNPTSEIESKARVPFEHLLKRGIDIRKDPVEFAPSIQHFNGGVLIDENASTDIQGLYACGEAAGGQHGADRPGGNALADSQVYGAVAGLEAAKHVSGHERQPDLVRVTAVRRLRTLLAAPVDAERDWEGILKGLRSVMWKDVSVVRNERGLSDAASSLGMVAGVLERARPAGMKSYLEFRNLLDIGQAVVAAAKTRTESRGTHYRSDYPRRDDGNWIKQILLSYTGKTPEAHAVRVEIPHELEEDLQIGRLTID